MNALNFTAREILPALLAKEKVQTIRSADSETTGKLKDPRFEVGEQVKVYWNQRSKHKYFDVETGKPWIEEVLNLSDGVGKKKMFNKVLGIIQITDVFRISMQRHDEAGLNRWTINSPDSTWKKKDLIVSIDPKKNDLRLFQLWKNDGFKSEREMFDWFHKRYNLDEERNFWVYKFRWLQEGKGETK
jgi:hypothetical protein